MTRYHLDDLGWLQFEQMCQSLLKATFGLSIQSWGRSSDLGRDAFSPQLVRLGDNSTLPGPVVFQAKYVAGANAAGAVPGPNLLKAIRLECDRIKLRVEAGTWQPVSSYVLLTNVPLTASLRSAIAQEVKTRLGDSTMIPWGGDDLCDMLDNCPHIRVAFPQVLSIRDLEALLATAVNKAVIERSRAAVEEARETSAVFVPTAAYYRAITILQEHGFVVLTGPPEMGKTAIARIVGLAKHTEGWQYLDCGTPNDFFQSLDDSVHQVFVADDAFGTTEYRPELAIPWGQQLPRILRRLGPHRWFLWTTRPAPLHFALQHLNLSGQAQQFPTPGTLHVDASALTPLEKAQMLYRHAKCAHLAEEAKALIRQHAMEIVSHEHFTPERVRRFVRERLGDVIKVVKAGAAARDVVKEAVRAEIGEPTVGMRRSFENLDRSYQDLLLALLDVDATPISERLGSEAYYRLSGNAELPPEKLVADLDGHFIRRRVRPPRPTLPNAPAENFCEWIHPSWRDIAIEFLATHKPYRQRFLGACGIAGIGLALSIGGGSKGDRASPLLRDDADWEALARRAVELAAAADDSLSRKLIVVLHSALGNVNDESAPAWQALNDIAGGVLDAVRAKWNTSQALLIPWYLKAYYELSVLVTPLRPSPLLDRSWRHYMGCLEEGITNEECAADMKDNLDWTLQFIELILANEPRFLLQQRFPMQHENLFSSCLNVLSKYNYRDSQPTDIDDLDKEAEYVEELQTICRGISNVCPSLAECADDVTAELQGQCDMAGEERDKLEQKKKDEDRAEEEWREAEEYRDWIARQTVQATSRPAEKRSGTPRPSRVSLLADSLTVDPMTHLFDDL